MYTYNNLFDEMISFPNLMRAAHNAQRGKRTKSNTARFNFHQEAELFQLQQELRDGTYQPGQYRSFYVLDPKKRLISAAPYRDRVVHHALCRIIEPIFESRFIHHSYACRVDKGTHRAIDKCQVFIRNNQYCLQGDIQKYFESINHEVLLDILKRWIKDERVIWLAGLIVGSAQNMRLPRPYGARNDNARDLSSGTGLPAEASAQAGLPIGNLTSQFFANVYLNELDYFVKFDLREKYYIRYMDDFLIFGNDKEHLTYLKERISGFLLNTLKLRLHEKKSTIFPVGDGVSFLGFRIFRDYRKILKENVKRFIRRMKRMSFEYRMGLPRAPQGGTLAMTSPALCHCEADGYRLKQSQITLAKITNSVQSWIAYARYGNTYNLRKKILPRMVFNLL
jgi:retron-type reverse transcriptase